MTAPKVTLFDLASKQNTCWSLNPWKTRLLLNYKGIPYETEWMEYPDLAPFFKSKGVPANKHGNTAYTIPTIKIDDEYIMDSKAIAVALESRFPTPSARLNAPKLKQVEELITACYAPLAPVIHPRVLRHLLNERSAEYFSRTRTERYGMSLEEVERTRGGEQAFAAAKGPWGQMAELVEGPFVMGAEVSYADFVIISALAFARRTGMDTYDKIVDMYPIFETVWENCRPWLERNDH